MGAVINADNFDLKGIYIAIIGDIFYNCDLDIEAWSHCNYIF